MAGYAIITNIDKVQQPYANYLWALLNGHNRKASEVTDWTQQIIGIPNSTNFGLTIGNSGDFTIFRKHKTDNTPADFANISISCEESVAVVFTTVLLTPLEGFNFSVSVEIIESGGHPPNTFEYGYALSMSDVITNWQSSNVFNLINEGIYFFDIRIKTSITTVGKQLIELVFSVEEGNFGGGDESDNVMPGTGSSED